MLDLDILARTPAIAEPFPHLTANGTLSAQALQEVARDFPAIDGPGIFPLSELAVGGAFARLVESVQSEALEKLLGEKLGVDLAGLPLMITVRGFCREKDGRIHTDSTDKVVTCLLYLNDPSWENAGGRLRLLRDGKNLDNFFAEVPPDGGAFVAFKRTDNGWHGHEPYAGRRRYIMFNWIRSDAALAKNLWRHKLSAFAKRIGLYRGNY